MAYSHRTIGIKWLFFRYAVSNFLKKPIDKSIRLCYNINTVKRGELNMRICFDMDGTIANLYGVKNWLEMLINKDETPYEKAEVLVNMNSLARVLNKLQSKGYEIGIISWLAKNSNNDYDKRVTLAKRRWLAKHLHSVKFDFIEIVSYGTPKSFVATDKNDILFDDEAHNREEWTGVAYDVHNIIEVLRSLP